MKNFLKAKELLEKNFQLDIIEDLLLSKKCRILCFADTTNLNNINLHLIAGDFSIFGLSHQDTLPLSQLMSFFDANNKYAEVAGKKEYQEYVYSQIMKMGIETDVTFPIKVGSHRSWIRFNAYAIDKNPKICFVALTNLSQLMNHEEELYEKTHRDSLTGLFNRYTFDYHYGLRYRWKKFHALYLDLDDFKQINDQCSHEAGNEFLIRFAAILKSYEDEYNHFYRLGGDEFVGMFFKDVTEIKRMAEEIIHRTRSIPLPHPMQSVSVSIGIVKADEAEQLYQKADKVLYDVKNHGKNHYRYQLESEIKL